MKILIFHHRTYTYLCLMTIRRIEKGSDFIKKLCVLAAQLSVGVAGCQQNHRKMSADVVEQTVFFSPEK